MSRKRWIKVKLDSPSQPDGAHDIRLHENEDAEANDSHPSPVDDSNADSARTAVEQKEVRR